MTTPTTKTDAKEKDSPKPSKEAPHPNDPKSEEQVKKEAQEKDRELAQAQRDAEVWREMVANGYLNPNLGVKRAGLKGLGVFALRDIEEGQDIEFCHAIVMSHRMKYVSDPQLKRYTYWAHCNCQECKNHGSQAVLPLGYGCIYNSADSQGEANAEFRVNASMGFVLFRAKKNIKEGDEILTWWGQGYYDTYCKPAHTKALAIKAKEQDSGEPVLIKAEVVKEAAV